MARIIRQGINPIDIKYHLTCRKCDSLIEFAKSEGKTEGDQREGYFLRFTCPCCGGNIDVSNIERHAVSL